MEHYLNIPVKKGLFRSPLRNDKNPTCSFTWDRNNRLILKDFSGDFYGDVFEVIKRVYNLSTYQEAIQFVVDDYNISKRVTLPKTEFKVQPKEFTNIQIEIQEFSQEELDWWYQFHITKDILNKFRVYSCRNVFLNKYPLNLNTKFAFAYYRRYKEKDYFRIYFPLRKDFRFMSNWTKDMIQGSQQLTDSDTLVITKSMKDVMTLYSFGITAIAPTSESIFISPQQFNYLKLKFPNLYLFYDNDYTGIKRMNIIRKQFDIKCIWLPRNKAKDISDYCKLYGFQNTEKLINIWKKVKLVNEIDKKAMTESGLQLKI